MDSEKSSGAKADRMAEAEVALRLAQFLVETGIAVGEIRVSIDGAQVRVGDRRIFDIVEFIAELGWVPEGTEEGWRGRYRPPGHDVRIILDSKSGQGDVVAALVGGGKLIVECKKGPLRRSKSNPEYPLLREALGQVLTMGPNDEEALGEAVIPAVAVPKSEKFAELAERWRQAPLLLRSGIGILLVDQDGGVDGLSDLLRAVGGAIREHGAVGVLG